MINLITIILMTGMILAVLVIFYFYYSFPSFKDFWKYCTSVEYRFMYNLYKIYRNKEAFGWDYNYTYLEKALNWLNEHLGKEGQNHNLAAMIYIRLSREEFVKHYFSRPQFTYSSDFIPMLEDMLNGQWKKRLYDKEEQLRKRLPKEVLSYPGGFELFHRLVDNGLCDEETGQWKESVRKGKRAVIAHTMAEVMGFEDNYGRVFSTIWPDENLTDNYSDCVSRSANYATFRKEAEELFPEVRDIK